MDKWFEVDGLEIERLLAEWHWLCPSRFSLVARNVFGELFLQDETGTVFWLNTTTGNLNKVSNSHSEFLEMAGTTEKRREWFVEHEAVTYAQLGLVPGATQCIGLVYLPSLSKVALPIQLSSQTSMNMFLSLETCTDKSQVRQMGVKCASESILHDRI